MKIALAQMEVIPFRPDLNVARMKEFVAEAESEGADVIAFPEMCVGGYFIGDKWTSASACAEIESYNNEIRGFAKTDITIIWGNVNSVDYEKNKDGRTRRYNSLIVAKNDVIFDIYDKTLLPTYRFFDDQRYFTSDMDSYLEEKYDDEYLEELREWNSPNEVANHKVGLQICEDLWCDDYIYQGERLNTAEWHVEKGAQLIINSSASPWTVGKNEARDRRVKSLFNSGKGVPFAYVNCVGAQNNGKNIITFDGGTTIYNSNGDPVIVAKNPYQEELIIANFDEIDKMPVVNRKTFFPIRQKYDAIIKGIRHIKDMNNWKEDPSFVIGLSGGKDSALVAALLVDAVGEDKVTAINMPSSFNSRETKGAAEKIADNLGIEYSILPIGKIEAVVKSIVSCIPFKTNSGWQSKYMLISPTQAGNIHAKIRGTDILSNVAAITGGLMTNNGNKVEVALGYATLYGDINGAVAPIADLTPTEVYEMIRFVNRHEEIIPQELVPTDDYDFSGKIFPSAELEVDQEDPIKFGYHCALLEAFMDYDKKSPEDILRWYLKGNKCLAENLGISEDLIIKWGLDDKNVFIKDLEWFWNTMNANVFKRVQCPPIIMTSKTSFGYDLRESMLPPMETKEYRSLKHELLNNGLLSH